MPNGVQTRTLGPKGVDWRGERVPAKTLGLEGGWDCKIPHPLGKRTKQLLLRVWKPLSSRESPKGKVQRGQYLLAIDLGCYNLIVSEVRSATFRLGSKQRKEEPV